jgi:hypothetical protein
MVIDEIVVFAQSLVKLRVCNRRTPSTGRRCLNCARALR